MLAVLDIEMKRWYNHIVIFAGCFAIEQDSLRENMNFGVWRSW